MLKNYYTHPLSKNNEKKNKKQTLFCHQRQKLLWVLPKTLGPRRNRLFSVVSTFGEQCCRPSIPSAFPSDLSSRAFGEYLYDWMFMALVIQPRSWTGFWIWISSHWLTAWVCLSKWLSHKYKCKGVQPTGWQLSVSVCWQYLFNLIYREKKLFFLA